MERPGLSLLSLHCPHTLLPIISRVFLRLQPRRRRGRARCSYLPHGHDRDIAASPTSLWQTLRRSSWAPAAALPCPSGLFHPPPPRARLHALASAPSRRRHPPALSRRCGSTRPRRSSLSPRIRVGCAGFLPALGSPPFPSAPSALILASAASRLAPRSASPFGSWRSRACARLPPLLRDTRRSRRALASAAPAPRRRSALCRLPPRLPRPSSPRRAPCALPYVPARGRAFRASCMYGNG